MKNKKFLLIFLAIPAFLIYNLINTQSINKGDNKMGFILIKGTFNVVRTSPDGDSVRFKANNKIYWQKLERKPRLNKKDFVQLRLEAIDALETHYRKNSLNVKQPEKYAKEALYFMLAELGIKNIVWTLAGKRVRVFIDSYEKRLRCRYFPSLFIYIEE
jgi:endonuclease YncB( thermonuclease family)